MRVVTTASKEGLKDYGHRWLDSRKNWPKGTEFHFYREGFDLDLPGKDFRDMPEFAAWKLKHLAYTPPEWKWNVVRYAHKVFAACDSLDGYEGIGVWLDADCVTYRKIPAGLVERQVEGVYLAHYGRTGFYTETGMWIMDCSHPEHKNFLDFWRNIYLADRFKDLPQWHDCLTLDATIRSFTKRGLIKTFNLSGEFHKTMHPQALSELGQFIDHTKGPRKIAGISPENKHRKAA